MSAKNGGRGTPTVPPPEALPQRQPATKTCQRCREDFGYGHRCKECGVGRNRVVRASRRRTIGGKRGRNSGKVRTNH